MIKKFEKKNKRSRINIWEASPNVNTPGSAPPKIIRVMNQNEPMLSLYMTDS